MNPGSLTVTASSATMPFGGTVPTITATITGSREWGDHIGIDDAANLLDDGDVSQSGWLYPSTCSGAAAANYTFTYVPGTVTVTGATLTITASSASILYGSAVPAISPLYTGFVPPDTAASLTTQPTCSVVELPARSPGNLTHAMLGSSFGQLHDRVCSGNAVHRSGSADDHCQQCNPCLSRAEPGLRSAMRGLLNGALPASGCRYG